MDLVSLLLWLTALYASLTAHEFMHAWTASYLGDDTARMAGRVTLNPFAHIDPIGTVLMPILLLVLSGGNFTFGYAKPVPINPNRFKNVKLGEALTSVAGPVGNLILALLFTAVYKFLPGQNSLFSAFLLVIIQLNLVLMTFNLIPIPPLDGSKVLLAFFPNSKFIYKLESYGPFLLFPLILILGSYIIGPVLNILMQLLQLP